MQTGRMGKGRRRARAAIGIAAVSVAWAATAAAQAPLPPLPDTPAAPPPPAPAGSVQDVTILPPLPALPPELPPPPPLPPNAPPAPLTAPALVSPAPPPAGPAQAPPAEVEAPSPRGVSLGLRVGVGFPIGQVLGQTTPTSTEIATANNLSDRFGVLFPVTADVGYRWTPHWYTGGYFSAGLATPSSSCTKVSNECQQNDLRFGVDAKYLASPAAFADPWIGAGLGWEIANHAEQAYAGHNQGPELLHLRAGLDFRVAPHLYIAPEATFTFGIFTDRLGTQAGGVVNSVALHDWFMLGLSAHYDR